MATFLKRFFSKVIRLPLKLIPKNKILSIKSGHNKGFKWIVGSGVHGYWLGMYEKEKLDIVLSCIKKDMVVYDIGAHAGYYSLAFSRAVKGGMVYSFEPNPKNISFLKTHFEINGVQSACIFPIGIGPKQSFEFFSDSNGSFAGAVSKAFSSYKISVFSIDYLVENNFIQPPDFIKIDIEGFERECLEGAKKTIEKYRPIVAVAIDDPENKDYIYEYFEASQYKVNAIHDNKSEVLCIPYC